MSVVKVLSAINSSDLNCNGSEERKILDLALSMANQNGGKFMCNFNSSYFNLTEKQINFISYLIGSYRSKNKKEPKFGCDINGIYNSIDLRVYSKFVSGSKRYEDKKYLILNINFN
jgi:hypothetical protein